MITTHRQTFLKQFRERPFGDNVQTMKRALLVSPEGFRLSLESMQDNAYMHEDALINLTLATEQHATVCQTIKDLGVPVSLFKGVAGQDDGIYPNNAFATIPGRAIIGKMFHPVRQRETTRKDVRNFFENDLKYEIRDLSKIAGTAELTGALIVDRPRNIGFFGLSNRCDQIGMEAMHDSFDFELSLAFELAPEEYHTNIILSILAGRTCLIYKEAIRDSELANAICEAYGDGAIILSLAEKNSFVGNCLAITPSDVLFSNTALDKMQDATRSSLTKFGFRIHGVDISELEKGGGSLRCLIAEVF